MQITVEDCDKLLTLYGYGLRKSSGSHRVYHKKYAIPIIVAITKHKKYVKPGYVDVMLRKLNLEE